MTQLDDLLLDLAATDDPYPVYDEIRHQGRVLWSERMGRWLVTGLSEVATLLAHPSVSSDRGRTLEAQAGTDDGFRPRGLPFTDPPDHTRLRSLVQQAFTPRAVERLRPRIERIAGDLLSAAADQGEFDLMKDVAGPLPAVVLAELLGIPAADQPTFRAWAGIVIETIDPVSHRQVSGEGERARTEMAGYLAEVIEERRRQPADDLISAMIAAEEAGNRLTGTELREMCLLLAVVGLETSGNLIGNGIRALLEHPAELARLRAEPDLIRSAVEELLRYDAPVQLAGRIPLEDIEIGGRTLGRGQTAGLILGAANRDPAAFTDPGRLDLGRRPNNHVGLGRGIHFCLGAPLARAQGAVVITMLVTRFPQLRPAGEPKHRRNVHVRGFESMPLAVA